MASKYVVEAVRAYLAANWNACPIVSPNAKNKAPGKEFIALQFPLANETPESIGAPGDNIWRETGGFRIVLQTESGRGDEQPLEWIDQLQALFRGKEFGGVQVLGLSAPVVADDNDKGMFFTLSFAVEYQFDRTA